LQQAWDIYRSQSCWSIKEEEVERQEAQKIHLQKRGKRKKRTLKVPEEKKARGS
jgi:hypothetical protein